MMGCCALFFLGNPQRTQRRAGRLKRQVPPRLEFNSVESIRANMRIRLITLPPFPPLKVWYPLYPQRHQQLSDSLADGESCTIASLKGRLLNEIRILSEYGTDASMIILLIDGFELLDASPLSVIHDGDLVVCGSGGSSSHPLDLTTMHCVESSALLQRRGLRMSRGRTSQKGNMYQKVGWAPLVVICQVSEASV